jgi:Helix-loop-helix DNA-binding domain
MARLRVKDINDAIKELGQMIACHSGSSQPMTRLMIVQEAVTVITALEQQLRGTSRSWVRLAQLKHFGMII